MRLLSQEAEEMRLLSNIIKSGFVSILENKKSIEVVDANDKHILNKREDSESAISENGFEAVDLGDKLTEDVSHIAREPEEEKESAEDILEAARVEALRIIEEAKENADMEAEMIRNNAYEEGFNQGASEAEERFAKEQVAFDEERAAFEAEYKNLVDSIEPRMVKLVMELVDNLVGYTAVEEQVIAFVLKKGFEEIELAGHITIKVSEMDYDFVMQQKSELVANISNQTIVEILIDYTLKKNDCVIETESGNINCSLDTRYKALKAELSLIYKSLMKE